MNRLPVLAIVTVVLLTLYPVVMSEFTTWDDGVLIWLNRTFNPPTLHSLYVWWTSANDRMWNPAVETLRGILALATTANKDPVTATYLNPYLFHATNLLLHLCTTLIVYQILRLLRFTRLAACGGAMVFGIHPLQVEPVAWASALKDVLCGTFAMGAIWFYLRSRGLEGGDEPIAPPPDPRFETTSCKRVYYWMAAALFLFATFSKPTAVVLPLMVLALACLIWKHPPRQVALDMLLWFILGMPNIIVTKLLQPTDPLLAAPLWQRPLIATDAVAFYLYKLVWPASLVIDYGRRPAVAFAHGWPYWTWIFPIGLAIALTVTAKRTRAPAVGAVVFLLPLLPVLGLVSFDFQVSSTVADRYVYLSFLGVAICVAWFIQRFSTRGAAISYVLIAAMGVKSWAQTSYWHDSMALFTHELQFDPTSAAALVNLSVAYDGMGQIATEIQYLNQAIEARPELPQAYLGLGTSYVKQGNWEKAADAYRRGFAVQPTEVGNEVIRLAGSYGKTDQPEYAVEYGKLAVELRPDSAMAHLNLGSALAEAHDQAGALKELERAVELDPSNVVAQCNLATTLAAAGKIDEAAMHYRAALQHHPGLAAAEDGLKVLQGLSRTNPGSAK